MLRAAGFVLKQIVKVSKNAAIRAANEGAGKMLPTIALEGVCLLTDDAVDAMYRFLVGMPEKERRAALEELGNAGEAELAQAVAAVSAESIAKQPGAVGAASPPVDVVAVRQHAVALASELRKNVRRHMEPPDATGRTRLREDASLTTLEEVRSLFTPALVLRENDVIAGRYSIERWLAEGGMGTVYLAKDTLLGGEVVLKTIRPALAGKPAFRKRFLEEGALARKLKHPHIARLHDTNVDDRRDLCYHAMEHVPGETLDRWLAERGGPASLDEFRKLSRALCGAVEHAHKQQILHLDIKPSNIMVTSSLSSVSLLDFGLGKLRERGDLGVSAPGGTAYYMAPEQERGQKVDQRADIYALGVVFYEVLTGYRPSAGSPPLSEERPDLPGAISSAVAEAMHADPNRRIVSVVELVQKLESTRSGTAPVGQQPVRTAHDHGGQRAASVVSMNEELVRRHGEIERAISAAKECMTNRYPACVRSIAERELERGVLEAKQQDAFERLQREAVHLEQRRTKALDALIALPAAPHDDALRAAAQELIAVFPDMDKWSDKRLPDGGRQRDWSFFLRAEDEAVRRREPLNQAVNAARASGDLDAWAKALDRRGFAWPDGTSRNDRRLKQAIDNAQEHWERLRADVVALDSHLNRYERVALRYYTHPSLPSGNTIESPDYYSRLKAGCQEVRGHFPSLAASKAFATIWETVVKWDAEVEPARRERFAETSSLNAAHLLRLCKLLPDFVGLHTFCERRAAHARDAILKDAASYSEAEDYAALRSNKQFELDIESVQRGLLPYLAFVTIVGLLMLAFGVFITGAIIGPISRFIEADQTWSPWFQAPADVGLWVAGVFLIIFVPLFVAGSPVAFLLKALCDKIDLRDREIHIWGAIWLVFLGFGGLLGLAYLTKVSFIQPLTQSWWGDSFVYAPLGGIGALFLSTMLSRKDRAAFIKGAANFIENGWEALQELPKEVAKAKGPRLIRGPECGFSSTLRSYSVTPSS